ncbi:hypothetical protein RSAG8_02810, partial [Rhizoctonia solani AG-8 WAC10335]
MGNLPGGTSLQPKDCQADEWFLELRHHDDVCLPTGEGPKNPPKPPDGSACPVDWYWHKNGHCVPLQAARGTSCSKGYKWEKKGLVCKRKRKSSWFKGSTGSKS